MLRQKATLFLSLTLCILLLSTAMTFMQAADPQAPDTPVKLIFIHHSCGENWLTDGYGDLGQTLGENNYFVSDTNYGWGPDAIGDRTDIPDWLEWFRGEQTELITQALYNESGQMSSYSRPLADPGGENTIVMFKSCFPNSELSGGPDDTAGTYADLSVSGAKYVYNELLQYFVTRPDKLFIVVTAPPVSSRANAENARAFNNWLVEDWLAENNYTQNNVAVFDFYTILTGKDAHHRYNNDQIEHVTANSNTLAYPSGDDHPSEEGSLKATAEFVPLLNYYYQRWQASTPTQTQNSSQTTAPTPSDDSSTIESTEDETESSAASEAATVVSMIDDFESDNPSSANGWEAFIDNPTGASMYCAAKEGSVYEGERALLVDVDVKADNWATCALIYDSAQDWSAAEGITFMFKALQTGLAIDIDLYTGSSDALETYVYTIETISEDTEGWTSLTLRWEDFQRVDWEENAGSFFASADAISGIAFGVNADSESGITGAIWVDNLALITNN